jgi:hypothetical protein
MLLYFYLSVLAIYMLWLIVNDFLNRSVLHIGVLKSQFGQLVVFVINIEESTR